ncbi:MAG: hypothetical protein JWQ35_1898 [Bacteriovoracaceae bacterium]|nr:hypothetical protein [Bacteriovoracaceae bacterium]
MLFIFASLQLLSAMDCTFQTAFEKGAQDVATGSFGSNIDRFCNFASAEDRLNFPKAYELGRQYGPTLKKGEITRIPNDQAELDALLKDAKLSLTTKEIVDRISTAPKGATVDNPDIKNLTKRIETLEEENKKLSEKLKDEGQR